MGLVGHTRLFSALLAGGNPSGLNALEHEELQRSRLKRLSIKRKCVMKPVPENRNTVSEPVSIVKKRSLCLRGRDSLSMQQGFAASWRAILGLYDN